MENLISTAEESGDLFGKMPAPRSGPVIKGRLPPELTAARVLCRQLRRKRAPRDKQRIAHLICLNLLSILKVAHAPHTPLTAFYTGSSELSNQR
jgi:hypothetical protein